MAKGFGYFWEEGLTKRNPGALCLERPQRLQVLAPELVFGGGKGVTISEFSPHDPRILTLVHDQQFVAQVEQAAGTQQRYLDGGDTRVTPDVFNQALWSASAGCTALDEIFSSRLERAFCAIRPPGHHANSVRAMSFCIFNNVAIAARYAQSGYGVERVLIVDWDLDPGNGTQEIFWEDPTVFTLSFHQDDLFPDAGRANLLGRGMGEGFNRNVPLPPGTDGPTYQSTLARVLQEIATSFKPQLLIIAAGFDAHQSDPQSRMKMTEYDFGSLTEIALHITLLFTDGRTLSILEGGYHMASLQHSVRVHCDAMARPVGPMRYAENRMALGG